jgi:hypothetical protein
MRQLLEPPSKEGFALELLNGDGTFRSRLGIRFYLPAPLATTYLQLAVALECYATPSGDSVSILAPAAQDLPHAQQML